MLWHGMESFKSIPNSWAGVGWGLGFLSFGEECPDFVVIFSTLWNYGCGSIHGHNTMSGIFMSENGIQSFLT